MTSTEERITFCRICEACCGMVATVEDGSKTGRVEVPVRLTDEMTPGVLALPQGWGHRGGWQTAVGAGGANYNDLTSSDPDDLDISGNAVYSAVPVRLEPVV